MTVNQKEDYCCRLTDSSRYFLQSRNSKLHPNVRPSTTPAQSCHGGNPSCNKRWRSQPTSWAQSCHWEKSQLQRRVALSADLVDPHTDCDPGLRGPMIRVVAGDEDKSGVNAGGDPRSDLFGVLGPEDPLWGLTLTSGSSSHQMGNGCSVTRRAQHRDRRHRRSPAPNCPRK